MVKKLEKIKKIAKSLSAPLMAIAIGLLFGGLIMLASGINPFMGIYELFRGGYGSLYFFVTTLTRATPIIFAAVAASIAWGSGYSSMGAAGQMILGALTAGIVAVQMPGPGWLVLTVSILAAMIVGSLYSLITAYISQKFEVSLLIVTLMSNYIADYIASYFTMYVYKDPLGVDASSIQTQQITSGILPKLFDKYALHTGFILAILVSLLVFYIQRKTTIGYNARMNGLNPRFALYGGIDSKKMMLITLMFSGAIAGLGGASEVLGTRLRYVDAMITSPGYAWTGIIASLMSSNNPLGGIFSSIFLAGLTTGGNLLERSLGVASEVTQIIEGVITLFITATIVHKFKLIDKFRERKQANE